VVECVTFYDHNVSGLARLQKRIFEKLGIPLKQIRTDLIEGKGAAHAGALDSFVRDSAARVFVIFDVDAFPLSISYYQELVLSAERGELAGIAQCMDWTRTGHVYVGPACMAFSRETFERLGQPSFMPCRNNTDVGEEFTLRAEERNVTVSLAWPTHVKSKRWRMGATWMGSGVTCAGKVFHGFESGKGGAGTESFLEEAYAFLGEPRPAISIVTTCMNRLSFLKESIPLWQAWLKATNQHGEIVLADWSCPENSGEWLSQAYPDSVVVRSPSQKFYTQAGSCNLAAGAATGRVLGILDCDVSPTNRTGELFDLFDISRFHRVDRTNFASAFGLLGSCFVPRRAWAESGGYDEVIQNYGHVDDDFYETLELAGFVDTLFSPELLRHAEHNNEIRTAHFAEKRIGVSSVYNTTYSRIKQDVMRMSRRRLSREERNQLKSAVDEAINAFMQTGNSDFLVLDFESIMTWLPHHIERKLVYALDLSKKLEFC